MKFLRYDISIILMAILSLAFTVVLFYFLVSGAYQNMYSRVQGVHKIFFHFSFMIVPILTGLVALKLNKEEDLIWRQIKLLGVAMPLIGYGAYWFYVSFHTGLIYSIKDS